MLTPQQDHVSGQMIVFPKQITTRLDLSRKIVIRYEGLLYNIPSSCFVNFERGFKIVLPPGTLPHEACSGGRANPMTFSCSEKDGNVVTMRRLFSEDNDENAAHNEVITIEKAPPTPGRKTIKVLKINKSMLGGKTAAGTSTKKSPPRNTTLNFNNLFTHFDALVTVFKYLRRPELLRAAQVCRVWRKASCDSSLVSHNVVTIMSCFLASDCFSCFSGGRSNFATIK